MNFRYSPDFFRYLDDTFYKITDLNIFYLI